jgi:hypothetical protein
MAHPKKSVNFSTPRNASKHGRFGDSLIAFLSPQAQAHLASKDNVLATINPLTGLPEYADISEEQSNANSDWVNSMYTQVFDRDADQAGSNYWSEQLNSGAVSQDDVMKSFLESTEYDNKQMEPDYNIDTIYDDVFGREADEAGSTYWNEQFDTTDTNYDDIVSSMMGSDEATNLYAAQEEEVEDVTEVVNKTFEDDDGTFSMEGANEMMSMFYDEHSVNDADSAGGEYWAGRLDDATSTSDILAIEQEFLTALSNDNGIDDDSGSFITDTSFLNEGSGYIEPTVVDETVVDETVVDGTDGDGTDGDGEVVDGTNTGLTSAILSKAADSVDTTSSDTEETAETVAIASEDGGDEAIDIVNNALLESSNLSEIMALLDRSNLRDMGVRYLRAIRDNQGNRIFYNMNAEEFNQNRNQLRRLYWGKGWKAIDQAQDDSGYGNRAAATTNFLGGA